MSDWVVLEGDCVERMREMDEGSIDAIVTDPPYGLEFMGKEWDKLGASASHREDRADELGEENKRRYIASGVTYGQNVKQMQEWHHTWATEALRVLKPGGHLLAFGGTRTYHRLACAIEDAGFEIRDSLIWLYGSGFPKSLDVSKAIDKAAGAEREVLGQSDELLGRKSGIGNAVDGHYTVGGTEAAAYDVTAPATPEAQKWNGWGTALKPGHEPIVVARKPLIGTVAANVQKYCVGAINIDGCRVEGEPEAPGTTPATAMDERTHGAWIRAEYEVPCGRWPANAALSHLPECREVGTRRVKGTNGPVTQGGKDGGGFDVGSSDGTRRGVHPGIPDTTVTAYECAPGCPIAELDEQSGERPVSGSAQAGKAISGGHRGIFGGAEKPDQMGHNDSGGASRFFYQAKASRGERNAGLDGLPDDERKGQSAWGRTCNVCGDTFVNPATGKPKCGHDDFSWTTTKPTKNAHPTVKPIDLMRWLVRLVTPPGGTVLDPFTGSGTTGIAAVLEGFDFIGIEREAEYVEIARARLAFWEPHGGRDTEDVLVEAGFSERLEREHREAGQMGLLDG